jgi:hypothetical protein
VAAAGADDSDIPRVVTISALVDVAAPEAAEL